jgi:hypothetical protein
VPYIPPQRVPTNAFAAFRAASKFVTRLIEFDFRSAADGEACEVGPELTIPDKTCHVRLKLPTMLGGLATPWMMIGRFSISGYHTCTAI